MHYENNEARFRFRNDEREGLVAWSSHSPNFTSLYYFLQGYIKGIMYSESPTTHDNMIARITTTFENIPSKILRRK